MENKKIIIVGATSGIGRGLAELFVSKNCVVGITGRRTELLEKIKSENPGKYFIKAFDIKDTSCIERNLDELKLETGGMDLLIISSGTGSSNDELDFEIENEVLLTNVNGFTCTAAWGYRNFRKQGYGQIAGISSIAGFRGNRYAASYGATKSFQMKYLEALRQKAFHEGSKIIITDIRPGFVDTAMAKSEKKFWVASVKEACSQIYNSIKKKKDIAYVTRRWRFIAWIAKAIPDFLYKRL